MIDNRLPQFQLSARKVLGDALKEGAKDTLITARKKAPFKKGHLRSGSDFKQNAPLVERITFWEEYARFQEFGGDGKRTVKRYSTSGTGKGYLKKSGDAQAKKLVLTFAKHGKRARA